MKKILIATIIGTSLLGATLAIRAGCYGPSHIVTCLPACTILSETRHECPDEDGTKVCQDLTFTEGDALCADVSDVAAGRSGKTPGTCTQNMNCTIQTCDENCHAIIQYHVAMQLTCRGNMQDPNSPQCWLVNASSPNRVSCLAAVVR